MSYTLFYVPMNFPASIVLDKCGLRVGLILGFGLAAIGLWVKTLVNVSFWYVVAGQTMMAIAQPFTLNAPTKVAGEWFSQRES